MRSAMAKAEEFMNFLKCSLMPKPVASSPVPAESIEPVASSPKPSCPSTRAQELAPSSASINSPTPELAIPEAPPLPEIFAGRITQGESVESVEQMECQDTSWHEMSQPLSTSPSTSPVPSASAPTRSLFDTLKGDIKEGGE
jgi:hypothetical protein